MKLLLPENTRSVEHLNFLFHEANVGMSLRHKNVIRVVKLVKQPKNNPYFIMEFFPSQNLKMRVMRKDPIVQEKAHFILRQAAEGLAHVNDRGWVHRDVKPDNILVNSLGEVRLIDFALATRIKKPGLFGGWFAKRSRKTAGTPSYMSPEQALGKHLDARSDIYSFGCTMYELTTRRPPFRAETRGQLLGKHVHEKPIPPKTYNPNVTDEFSDLVLRMLNKKREDRPRDFFEILAALRNTRVFKGDKLESAAR
jgi:serine/threonine protein kinase